MATAAELLATTHEFREKKPSDLVADNIPLLWWMKKNGGIKIMNGGRTILEPARLSGNDYVQRINAREEINLGSNPVLGNFEYSPKIIVVPTVIDALERAQNQGEAEILDLYDERLEVADESLSNEVEADLQGDGTTYGGKAFAGIQSYILTSPGTGSTGGVSRTTYPQIRNVAVDAPSTFTGATTSSNFESRLRTVRNRVVLQNKGPKLALLGEDYYNMGADAVSAKQRFTQNAEMVKAGFDNYEIAGMVAVLATGKVFSGLSRIGSKRAYLIAPETMRLRMYRGYNFEPVKDRSAVNQLIDVGITCGIGQFTTNNPALNAVMYDV